MPARGDQLDDLEALGYDGSPIPWGYITMRQAKVLIERLRAGEPLWEGGTGEPEAAPALPKGGQGVLL